MPRTIAADPRKELEQEAVSLPVENQNAVEPPRPMIPPIHPINPDWPVLPIDVNVVVLPFPAGPVTTYFYLEGFRPYEGGGYVLESYAGIADYVEEEGGPKLLPPEGRLIDISKFRDATVADMARVNAILAQKGVEFNHTDRRFECVRNRVVGGKYWFVNDRLVTEAATDDGGAVHAGRFNAKNYFVDSLKEYAESFAKEVRFKATQALVYKY